MDHILINLMTAPQTYLNGKPVCFPYQKAEALFYYIAIEKVVTRDRVMAMFWADLSERAASQNLRQTLYVLKKVFGCPIIKPLPNRQLRLSDAVAIHCDLDDFYQRREIGIYKGEILSGLYIRNAALFEEWLLGKRESAKNFFLSNYLEYMQVVPKNKLNILEDYFYRYVHEDPFDERAYMIMLKAYLENNLPHKGILLYQKLCTLLDREFGIEPDDETTAVYYRLLNHRITDSGQGQMSDQEMISQEDRACGGEGPVCHGAELTRLKDLYAEYLEGKGRAVLLSGERGIGKSFLLSQFVGVAVSKDATVINVTCYIKNKELMLQPWNDLTLQLHKYICEKRIEIPHTWVEAANRLIPAFAAGLISSSNTGDANYNYQESKNSIVQILLLIARRTQLVILFENIHAMDALSLDILASLVHAARQEIFILCTSFDIIDRDTETFISAAHNNQQLIRIHLSPVSFEEAEMFIRAKQSFFHVTDEQIKEIYKRSQGNLFFIDELFDNVKSGRSLDDFSPRAQDMLNDQLNGLSESARRLLDVISVFAQYVVLDELCYIQNEDSVEISRQLDQLKGRGLILEKMIEDRVCFVFAHLCMRDFIYSKIPPARKRELHELAGKACENISAFNLEKEYHLMIRHYSLAGNYAKTIHYKIQRLSNEMFPDYQSFSDFTKEQKSDLLPAVYMQNLLDELASIKEQQPEALEYDRLEAILLLAKSRCCLLCDDVKAGISAFTSLMDKQYVWTDHQLLFKAYLQMLHYIVLNGGGNILNCMDKEYEKTKGSIGLFERAAFQQLQAFIATVGEDKAKAMHHLGMVASQILEQ